MWKHQTHVLKVCHWCFSMGIAMGPIPETEMLMCAVEGCVSSEVKVRVEGDQQQLLYCLHQTA